MTGVQHLAHTLIAFCIGGELANLASSELNDALTVLLQLDGLSSRLDLLQGLRCLRLDFLNQL